jgi:hypothetical protein
LERIGSGGFKEWVHSDIERKQLMIVFTLGSIGVGRLLFRSSGSISARVCPPSHDWVKLM